MWIVNADEFSFEQNLKKYIISISIEEEQLCLTLTLLSNPAKKYSGFFSLNELRISSAIFNHTKTLFEAKELIKRTIIKKLLLINENEIRANIIFNPGLGHNSIPFPIVLFIDSIQTYPKVPKDNLIPHTPRDNIRKSFINKSQNKEIINNNNIDKFTNGNQVIKTYRTILRTNIGNSSNNKLLEENRKSLLNVGKINLGNIQFNNSMKRINIKNNLNNLNYNFSKAISQKNVFQNNKTFYKKEDSLTFQKDKNNDDLELNSTIIKQIYNNMDNENKKNLSFYRNLNLPKSFNQNGKDNIENKNNIYINTDFGDNMTNLRKSMIKVDNNNSFNQPYLQKNLNISSNNIFDNLNNPKINVNNILNTIPNYYNDK